VLATALAAPVAAQDTISTDRPGLGFNPALIAPGVVQVEAGVPAVTTGEGTELYSFPALLRVGVTDRLELRAGTSLYDIDADADADNVGFDTIELSAKVGVLDGSDGVPRLAVIPAVFIPTESGSASVSVNATAGWSLPSGFGLTTVAGIGVADDEATFALVGVLGRSLSDALSAYVEAGMYPGPGDDAAYAGGGVALLVSPDLQLDAFVDLGLTDAAADVIAGTGVSLRF
jgi:hypothetical protein